MVTLQRRIETRTLFAQQELHLDGRWLGHREGKFQLDDKVCDFFPEDLPESPSPKLLAMRVRDLLTMSTGHASEPRVGASEPWTKTFLHHEVVHEPGSHFLYNTPATYMLSAIIQKQTGQTTHDYLQSRLFEPLGIVGSTWGKSPQGVSLGGYGLNVRTEDIAAFGLMYLNKASSGKANHPRKLGLNKRPLDRFPTEAIRIAIGIKVMDFSFGDVATTRSVGMAPLDNTASSFPKRIR